MPTLLPLPRDGGGSTDARVRRLQDQLYTLTEQLNYVLTHLDTGNFSADTADLLQRSAHTAAEAEAQTAALTQENRRRAEQLRAEILNRTQLVLAEAEAMVQAGDTALAATVAATYTAKDDTAALSQKLTSRVEQTAEAVQMQFAEANAYTLEVDGRLQQLTRELASYIRFDSSGIELGKVDSPFLSRLGDRRLSFLQNGTEIAYISDHRMYITHAQVAERLTLGSGARGYFDFVVEADGSLSLIRKER